MRLHPLDVMLAVGRVGDEDPSVPEHAAQRARASGARSRRPRARAGRRLRRRRRRRRGGARARPRRPGRSGRCRGRAANARVPRSRAPSAKRRCRWPRGRGAPAGSRRRRAPSRGRAGRVAPEEERLRRAPGRGCRGPARATFAPARRTRSRGAGPRSTRRDRARIRTSPGHLRGNCGPRRAVRRGPLRSPPRRSGQPAVPAAPFGAGPRDACVRARTMARSEGPLGEVLLARRGGRLRARLDARVREDDPRDLRSAGRARGRAPGGAAPVADGRGPGRGLALGLLPRPGGAHGTDRLALDRLSQEALPRTSSRFPFLWLDVQKAGLAAGLVDNKIAAFSPRLTSIRFVVPVARRAPDGVRRTRRTA